MPFSPFASLGIIVSGCLSVRITLPFFVPPKVIPVVRCSPLSLIHPPGCGAVAGPLAVAGLVATAARAAP